MRPARWFLSATAGDFNANGAVDVGDYSFWRKGLGTTFQSCDYNAWRVRFGNAVGSGANSRTAVPECTALVLVSVVAFISANVSRSIAIWGALRLMATAGDSL